MEVSIRTGQKWVAGSQAQALACPSWLGGPHTTTMEKSTKKVPWPQLGKPTTYFLLSLFSPSHLPFVCFFSPLLNNSYKKRTHWWPTKKPRCSFSWSRSCWQQMLHRQESQVLYVHTSQDYRSLDARKIPWSRLQLCDSSSLNSVGWG